MWPSAGEVECQFKPSEAYSVALVAFMPSMQFSEDWHAVTRTSLALATTSHQLHV